MAMLSLIFLTLPHGSRGQDLRSVQQRLVQHATSPCVQCTPSCSSPSPQCSARLSSAHAQSSVQAPVHSFNTKQCYLPSILKTIHHSVTVTRISHYEQKLGSMLFDRGVVNTMDDNCEQQVPTVALRLQQLTTAVMLCLQQLSSHALISVP